MKVVLLKDVKDTGRKGDVVDCSDGHAQNFLIPRGLAVLATPAALKQVEMRAGKVAETREVEKKLIEERIAALADGQTTITKKANDQGHLYDAVDAREIAAATALPVEAIKLEKPIKEVGSHQIPVAQGEAFGTIAITIVAE